MRMCVYRTSTLLLQSVRVVSGEKNILRNVRGKCVCIIADIIKSARDGLLVRIQRNAPTRWAEHPRYLKIRPKGFKRSENG